MNTRWWYWDPVRLALVFAAFGLLAGGGAVVFPRLRTTLFVLYWTFLFAAALLWFLTPERRIRARISERIYADIAANEAALVAAYESEDTQVYVPRSDSENDPPAWLFIPLHADYDVPDDTELESLSVVSDREEHRGLSLVPSGSSLFGEFESMLNGDLSGSPDDLSIQLADGLTEGLELADRVTVEVHPAEQRVVFEVTNNLYGPVDRFDHPVSSFLAVGLAVGLGRPIATETRTTDGRSDHTVICYWGSNDVEGTRDRRSHGERASISNGTSSLTRSSS